MKNKYNSGKSARLWRNSIISDDIRNNKPVRTLQFPLDHMELSPEFIENAKNTFLTVRGVGYGSLTQLVQVMLLCGFRICNNAVTAKNISANVDGAIAWQSGAVAGSQNEIGSIINSDSIMQSCYAHLKNLPDNLCNEIYISGKVLTDKKTGQNKVLDINERFVDRGSNGFSRLFGKEPEIWDKSEYEIKQYYGIPDNKDYVIDIVKQQIERIKAEKLYNEKNYSNLRKMVQGNIHSWASNYDKRIKSLIEFVNDMDSILSEINLSVCENNQQDLFKGLPIDYDQLIQSFDSIKLNQHNIKKCLDIINGNAEGEVEHAIKEIFDFNEVLMQFSGILNSLNENIKKHNDNLKDKKLKLKQIKVNKKWGWHR